MLRFLRTLLWGILVLSGLALFLARRRVRRLARLELIMQLMEACQVPTKEDLATADVASGFEVGAIKPAPDSVTVVLDEKNPVPDQVPPEAMSFGEFGHRVLEIFTKPVLDWRLWVVGLALMVCLWAAMATEAANHYRALSGDLGGKIVALQEDNQVLKNEVSRLKTLIDQARTAYSQLQAAATSPQQVESNEEMLSPAGDAPKTRIDPMPTPCPYGMWPCIAPPRAR